MSLWKTTCQIVREDEDNVRLLRRGRVDREQQDQGRRPLHDSRWTAHRSRSPPVDQSASRVPRGTGSRFLLEKCEVDRAGDRVRRSAAARNYPLALGTLPSRLFPDANSGEPPTLRNAIFISSFARHDNVSLLRRLTDRQFRSRRAAKWSRYVPAN